MAEGKEDFRIEFTNEQKLNFFLHQLGTNGAKLLRELRREQKKKDYEIGKEWTILRSKNTRRDFVSLLNAATEIITSGLINELGEPLIEEVEHGDEDEG